jgi:outer membrane protein assembly factor BamA
MASVGYVSVASQQQTPADAAFVVDTVVVSGAKRFTDSQVVTLSALTNGTTVRLADIEAAARRIAGTGLFDRVSYRYTTISDRITVTFEIQEAAWTMPVVFDNFVWMTEAELVEEVGRGMPTFDGTSPVTDEARMLLAATLQQSLQRRNLPGTVEIVPYLNMKTKAEQYVARVVNPGPAICAVQLPGVSPAMERELSALTTPLSGTDYSRQYATAMAGGSLLGAYQKAGYWGAVASEPRVTLDAGCRGVAVTLEFTEGPVYQWEAADWSGNAALAADELTKLLPLRPGDVAESLKLEQGVRNVTDAYGTVGHLRAVVAYAPHLIPDTRRVRFAMQVTEGAQFRMGALTITGLPPNDIDSLQKKWPLKAGDVYNTSLAQKFWRDEGLPLLRRLRLSANGLQLSPGSSAETVDVRITVAR